MISIDLFLKKGEYGRQIFAEGFGGTPLTSNDETELYRILVKFGSPVDIRQSQHIYIDGLVENSDGVDGKSNITLFKAESE